MNTIKTNDVELSEVELNAVSGGTSDFIRAGVSALQHAITVNSGSKIDLNDNETLRPFGERAYP
jgi:hypothetical protein